MKEKIKNQVIIDIAKHPKIYEHLKKISGIKLPHKRTAGPLLYLGGLEY